MNTKQKVFMGLALFAAIDTRLAVAQTKTEAKIYVCTDKNGVVTLQNLSARLQCVTHTVSVPVATMNTQAVRSTPRMTDPQPASGAVMVGTQVNPVVQKTRDQSRIQILVGELGRAQERLVALQTEASSPSSLRLNSDLKKNLALAEENVASLKRELDQVAGSSSFVFSVQ